MYFRVNSTQANRAMPKKEDRNKVLGNLMRAKGEVADFEKSIRKAERDLDKLEKENQISFRHYGYHDRLNWMAKQRDVNNLIGGLKSLLEPALNKVNKLEATMKDIEEQEKQASPATSVPAPVTTSASSATQGQASVTVQQPSGSITSTPAPAAKKKPMTVRKLTTELHDLEKRYQAYRDGAMLSQGLGVSALKKYRAQLDVVLDAYQAEGVKVWLRHDLNSDDLPDPEDVKQAAAESQGKTYRRKRPKEEDVEEEVHEALEEPTRVNKKRKASTKAEQAAAATKKRKVQAPTEKDATIPEAVAAPAGTKRKHDRVAPAKSAAKVAAADAEDDDEDDEPPFKRTRRAAPQKRSTFQSLGSGTAAASPAATTLAKKRRVDAEDDGVPIEHTDKRAKLDSPPDSTAAPTDREGPEAASADEQQLAAAAKKKAISSLKPAYYARDPRSPPDGSKDGREQKPRTPIARRPTLPDRARPLRPSVKTLHVSPLPPRCTEGWLRDLFAEYGFGADKVQEVVVKEGRGQGGGFAFVKFWRSDEARGAVRELDGVRAGGRRVRVEVAREDMRGGGRR